MLIKEFTQKKVAGFLAEKPKKVLLIFWHGLGDLLMFIPQYQRLCQLFPDTEIHIGLEAGLGFSCLLPFGSSIEVATGDRPAPGYDYTFVIGFPMCEYSHVPITKAELCCQLELGIRPNKLSHPILTDTCNPASHLVGVAFQSTALPDMMNIPEPVAEKIWNEIKQAGFTPVETLVQHKWFNQVNTKYPFVDRHCRPWLPDIMQLQTFMASCFAHLSVSTGNFHLAMALDPKRVLYLKRSASVKCYTRAPVPEIDVNNYEDGCVVAWLKSLLNEPGKKFDVAQDILTNISIT